MQRKEDIVVGLDIGTTKICAVVGEVSESAVNIIGIGTHPTPLPASLSIRERASALRAAATTVAPLRANLRAVSRPMPLDAPVTIAMVPASIVIARNPVPVLRSLNHIHVWYSILEMDCSILYKPEGLIETMQIRLS